jgi:hypothetical protein
LKKNGKPQKKESNRIPRNKKSLIQTKNTVEGHSSKLEQMEDRISELKEKNRI